MTEIKLLHRDQEATIRAKVSSISDGKTKTGETFFSLNLEDLTDTITAKIWNAENESIEKGKVYRLLGKTNEYNGKLQFIIDRYEEEMDESIIEQYFKNAPVDRDALKVGIDEYIDEILDLDYKIIVKEVYTRYEEELYSYPAATQNHHAYVSGLAFHTLTMLKHADNICNVYDFLDRGLLYSGVLLHDFAKVLELSAARSPQYTLEGNLIGHLVMGSTLIQKIGDELGVNPDKILYLQHMVVSHHGRKEWGSPQRPSLAEAEALHFIDNLDSKMESIRLEFEDTKSNEWTKRIPVLEGRSIYKHR